MSISRIDFQGTIARTNDFSQIKQNEDNKVMVDQNVFQNEFNKEDESNEENTFEFVLL